MITTLGELKKRISSILAEEAWVPGRYYPATNEPMSPDEQARMNQPNAMSLGEQDDFDDPLELDEVDTDPSNNPGRPDDPYDYLGMHTKPGAALAHPAISGGVPSSAPGSSSSGSDAGAGDIGGSPDEDGTEEPMGDM